MDQPLPKKCSTPGCDCGGKLVMHSQCHVDAPLWPVLVDDVLFLTCSECRGVVVAVRVTGVVPEQEAKDMICPTIN